MKSSEGRLEDKCSDSDNSVGFACMVFKAAQGDWALTQFV